MPVNEMGEIIRGGDGGDSMGEQDVPGKVPGVQFNEYGEIVHPGKESVQDDGSLKPSRTELDEAASAVQADARYVYHVEPKPGETHDEALRRELENDDPVA